MLLSGWNRFEDAASGWPVKIPHEDAAHYPVATDQRSHWYFGPVDPG
jgi:hypothetical protein